MKRKKLSIDKLEIGLLSRDQEMNIRGGEAEASLVIVNGTCVGKTEPPAETILTGCTITTPPDTTQTVMTCPATSPPGPIKVTDLC
ncbi:hypothetical protein [Pedobacter borealis]|uniref:hypothetical protein n=1 Tax=Pedobacter borealis TaxID=475254 RepID=UPI000492F64D|nr:hypothetical protein [Pedobacter borealis]